MRSWLFAHNGTIQRFDAIKPRLLETMPDFIRRNVRGETDSEHFFHVALSFLHDAGQLERPDSDSRAVLSALRSTVRLVDRLAKEVGAAPATLNCVLTNGRAMYAVRRGAPLIYCERTGIHDPLDGDVGPGDRGAGVRYVMIASDGGETPHGWTEVPEGSVCAVDRELTVAVHPL
jgi:glutamine amidotransferase